MPKIAEKIKLPEHGHGSILRYEGVTAWYSKFSHHGKEHVESLGTDDRKKALAAHRAKVKLLGAADLSFTEFQSRSQKRKVTIGRLLDDYITDCTTRKLKGLPQVKSHVATIRTLWGESPAATITAPVVAKQIEAWQDNEVADATINRRTQVLSAARYWARGTSWWSATSRSSRASPRRATPGKGTSSPSRCPSC